MHFEYTEEQAALALLCMPSVSSGSPKSPSSMGRRFPNTPPPRPSAGRSALGSSTPPPAPTTPRGGYSDRGLPTNNQITFSSNRPEPTKAARQARMVGDLARSQQADARQADQVADQSAEGETRSSSDSVLDAANMKQRLPSGSLYDEAPEDADGPANDYKQKNENFRQEQALAAQRGRQFNSATSNSDGMTESSDQESSESRSSPNNAPRRSVDPAEESRRATQLAQRQQTDARIVDLKNTPSSSGGGLQQIQNAPLPVVGASGSQLAAAGARMSNLLSAASGFGIIWALPIANLTAINRYLNSRLLVFGYRPPEEREASGNKFLNMLDVVMAIIVNLIATVYLLPLIGMIAAIILVAAIFVLGAAYLTPLIGELATQLMN